MPRHDLRLAAGAVVTAIVLAGGGGAAEAAPQQAAAAHTPQLLAATQGRQGGLPRVGTHSPPLAAAGSRSWRWRRLRPPWHHQDAALLSFGVCVLSSTRIYVCGPTPDAVKAFKHSIIRIAHLALCVCSRAEDMRAAPSCAGVVPRTPASSGPCLELSMQPPQHRLPTATHPHGPSHTCLPGVMAVVERGGNIARGLLRPGAANTHRLPF